MKQNNLEIKLSLPFEETVCRAREAIVSNGFLLLHEIDTQMILATHHISIPAVRQLLFFNPVYMKDIMEQDPAAVIEAPLKLVLMQNGPAQTAIHFFDPLKHFEAYHQLAELGQELNNKTTSIINAISHGTIDAASPGADH